MVRTLKKQYLHRSLSFGQHKILDKCSLMTILVIHIESGGLFGTSKRIESSLF